MSVPSSELAPRVMAALTPPDSKLIYTCFSSYEYECFRREKLRHVEQWWANLDQASKHLEVFRFRDLSPTPIP
jgi:hypothetical protein